MDKFINIGFVDQETPSGTQFFLSRVNKNPTVHEFNYNHSDKVFLLYLMQCAEYKIPRNFFKVSFLDYENFYAGIISPQKESIESHFHITVHPYSTPPRSEFVKKYEKLIFHLAKKQILIAASGHDGKKWVRFPACVKYVHSVGVSDEKSLSSYCGRSIALCKPDITINDKEYSIGLGQNKNTINGTSAACAILAANITKIYYELNMLNITPEKALVESLMYFKAYRNISGKWLKLPVIKENFLNKVRVFSFEIKRNVQEIISFQDSHKKGSSLYFHIEFSSINLECNAQINLKIFDKGNNALAYFSENRLFLDNFSDIKQMQITFSYNKIQEENNHCYILTDFQGNINSLANNLMELI